MLTAQETIQSLATAFGGRSQVPLWVYGRALVGQVNNATAWPWQPGTLQRACDDIVEYLGEHWDWDDATYVSAKMEIERGAVVAALEFGIASLAAELLS